MMFLPVVLFVCMACARMMLTHPTQVLHHMYKRTACLQALGRAAMHTTHTHTHIHTQHTQHTHRDCKIRECEEAGQAKRERGPARLVQDFLSTLAALKFRKTCWIGCEYAPHGSGEGHLVIVHCLSSGVGRRGAGALFQPTHFNM